MADHGRSDFYVVFTMSLCALGLKQQTYTDLHKFDAVPIVQTLSLLFSSKVFPKLVNVQDNGPVKILNVCSNFYYLCLMHADEIITLSLTFKREFGIGQLLISFLFQIIRL